MEPVNPHILSIAGFDPSAGAGILSDIKTFEAHGLYATGVCTAITIQNDLTFESVDWIPEERILAQIKILSDRFLFDYIKIGLIENLDVLQKVVEFVKNENKDAKIIWDPIIKASAGFTFHPLIDSKKIQAVCNDLFLVTPNIEEAKIISPKPGTIEGIPELSKYCAIYLKGGHSDNDHANDFLFENGRSTKFESIKFDAQKHGTGCVLSSAITAGLAQGLELADACAEAKAYVAEYLISARGLLGLHKKKVRN
ncbi:MAG: hydroxymethylpyrimidine/phosphomethylpyrimidine kinase [Bacteroidota bacterium]|nr:hydroxymethylpyrimidine/phosphomethylpyrimidine kinase [Bacteroidota bacterium]